MITLNCVSVKFNPNTPTEKMGLNSIDLNIGPGEFVTVVGTNGAGKSTLLHTIAGDFIPTSGKIQIHDQDVTNLPSYRRAHLVGRVFQDPLVGTCGKLSIEENMALASHRGIRRRLSTSLRRELKQQFKEALSELKLGLENRLETPMEQLSGGQRQAVSLIMTTLRPLQVLLLDEHTSALDPKTAEFIMTLTQKLVQEKKITALMVTHSLHQAIEVGNRTLLLHEGKIVKDLKESDRSSLTPQGLFLLLGS